MKDGAQLKTFWLYLHPKGGKGEDARRREGVVRFDLLVTHLVGNGEGQAEAVVLGKNALPLLRAHAAEVRDPCQA